jgi:heme-degrading monooxygenase HmoA
MVTAIVLSMFLQVAQHGLALNPAASCDGATDKAYCAQILPMIDSVKPGASASQLRILVSQHGWPTKELVGQSASEVAATVLQRASPQAREKATVARVWRGRVPTRRAAEYEHYLAVNGIAKIRTIPGNAGAQMLRHDVGKATTEFIVVSYWRDREAIHAFAGKDISKVHDLPRDKEFLVDTPTVEHYDIRAGK